jgi:predicted PurR-regulated permease PerM
VAALGGDAVTGRPDLARTTLALLFIGGLIVASFMVVRPFLAAIVWATTLVIATWPLMLNVQAALGGRRGYAVAAMTLILLLTVLLPLSLAIGSVVTHIDLISSLLDAAPRFHLPPPPGWIADIPLIGEPAAKQWQFVADSGVADLLKLVRPYMGAIAQWFVSAAGSVGGLFIHLLITIGVAAVLYAKGEDAGAWCRSFGRRLADERGEQAVILAGQAIRGVALGIVVTAVVQSLVVGIGLWIAGLPQPGILTAIVLLLCIAQLGPALVAIPAIIWLFATGAVVPAIVLIVFTVPAMALDNLLRPILIKRGADLPFLLILVGVIGGLLSFGLLGLFLGPVILGVSYTLLQHWIAERDPA